MRIVMIFAFLLIIEVFMSGCSTYTVMKDCKQLNPQDEELKEYYACHQQFKIWQ